MCNFSVNAETGEAEIESDYFYNNLTQAEQLIYKEILNSKGGILGKKAGEISISFPSGLGITDYLSERSVKEKLNYSISAALSSLIADHPELYWVGEYSSSCSVGRNGLAYVVKSVNIKLKADGSWENTSEKYSRLIDTAMNFEVKGSTAYEKVKYIHDTLCAMISYPDSSQRADYDSTAYNALVAPHLAVCGGYAGAFKLICALNGIECVSVFGESVKSQYIFGFIQKGETTYHQWNYVKMDDGKWYGIDLTWDDQGEGKILYDYFLSGSETRAPSFGNEKFSESHIEKGSIYGSDYSLSYPKISESAYVPSVEASGRIGDVNSDGTVTLADAKAVLSFLSGRRQLSEIEASSADVNKDGRITVVDAKRILQYLAGIKEL